MTHSVKDVASFSIRVIRIPVKLVSPIADTKGTAETPQKFNKKEA